MLLVGLGAGYGIGYYSGLSSVHPPTTLLIDGAGTLAVPWNGIVNNVLRQEYPTLSYNYIFEGSGLAANEITQAILEQNPEAVYEALARRLLNGDAYAFDPLAE